MNQQDLRVLKSEEAIKEAFISLIEKKGFAKVTVKDITSKAIVNRGTFYLHHVDKFALLDEIENSLLEGLGIFMSKIPVSDFRQATTSTIANPILVSYFEYIQQNERLFKILLLNKSDMNFVVKLKHFVYSKIIYTINLWTNEADNTLIPPEYLATIASSVYAGLFCYWLESGMTKTPVEMGKILTAFWKYDIMNLPTKEK